jgi:hypothetical protein
VNHHEDPYFLYGFVSALLIMVLAMRIVLAVSR